MSNENQPRNALGEYDVVARAGYDDELIDEAGSVDRVTRQTDAPIQQMSLQASTRRVREWARLVDDGDIDLDPPYQRGDVWTPEQRVALIESLLRGVPVPSVTVNDRWSANRDESDSLYALIDGKQRLTTALMWHRGEFGVPASWFDPSLIGQTEQTEDGPYVRYTGLTDQGRRYFDSDALIPVSEAQVRTVEEEAHIYLLLNKGGTAHTEGDLARAQAVAGKRERSREAIARRMNPRAWESFDRLSAEDRQSAQARDIVQHTLDEADGILDTIAD